MKKKENIFKKGFKKLWVEEEHKSFSDAEIDELISNKSKSAAQESSAPFAAPSYEPVSDFSGQSSAQQFGFSQSSQPDIMSSQGSYQFGSYQEEQRSEPFSSGESFSQSDSFSMNSPYNFSPYDFAQEQPSEPEPSYALTVADENGTDYGGGIFDPDGIYIDWKDDAVAVSKLSVKNFENFAKTRFEEIFLTAYSGARSKEKALSITGNVLARMLSYEAFAPDAENTPLSYAIESSLFVFMTKAQRAAAQEHPISIENVRNKPTGLEKDSCIQKAFAKGKRDIPRYAPVFSGTTGATVVLLIVAVIIAATAFVWAKPFGHSDELVSGSDVSQLELIYVDSLAAINPNFLIDLNAKARETAPSGDKYTSSALPIVLELNGPDVVSLSDISVKAPNGSDNEIYQFSAAGYCFFADQRGNYRITAHDTANEQNVGYIRLASPPAVHSDLISLLNGYYAVAHDREAVFELFDKAALEELGYSASITKYPASSVMTLSEDMATANFASQGITGLESFTVKLSGKNSADSIEFVVPLIIYNNAPRVDAQSLRSTLRHTPNENGIFAGHLSASDPDSDAIRFALTSTKNCSVMLAPNGGFICVIDKGCTEDTAWFGFTVSDGLLTTIEYRRVFELENKLLDRNEYSQDFVCYAGDDGWYELDLPNYDLDGDALRWRVVSSLENGITELGNAVKVSIDGHTVSYKIDPGRDEAFEETILLVCSDGWDSSDPISFTCRVKENAAPVGTNANNVVISNGESVICRFSLAHDCIFDKDSDCRIVEITRCRGGEIIGTDGWENLSFTFKHDGEREQCYVDAVIEDKLTGKRETVRFHITVQ